MPANIGNIGEPPGGDFVEMIQTREGARVEQVRFEMPKGSLDLTFRFRPEGAAGHRLESIIGCKGQEACVVNRLFSIAAGHDDFHVVV